MNFQPAIDALATRIAADAQTARDQSSPFRRQKKNRRVSGGLCMFWNTRYSSESRNRLPDVVAVRRHAGDAAVFVLRADRVAGLCFSSNQQIPVYEISP